MRGRSRLRTRGRTGSNSLLSRATALLGTAPLHYWDFTTNRALFNSVDVGGVTSTPGWSFTRASTGFANQTPNPEFGSQNLCLQSQTFGTSWTITVLTVTSDAVVAPDGTTTADTLTPTSNPFASLRSTTSVALTLGASYALSVFMKAGTTTASSLGLYDATGVDFQGRLNITWTAGVPSTGSTSGTVTNPTYTALANGWYRISFVTTADAANTNHLIYIYPDTAVGTNTLHVWGAQLELGTSPTTYKPTTTVAVTDTSGPPLVSFGSGVLRRTNKGVLIEGAGTNLCLQSQTFGTTWTVVGSAQSADQFVAPDATTTGDQITATAGLSAHYTTQNFTWTAAVHTVSVYVKYVNNRWFAITTFDGTTSRNASFDLLNGVVGALSNATSTITAVGGGWYRCTMTGSTAMAAAAGNIAFNVNATNVATNESYTALGTEIVGLWGAQIEASGFSSSYIPTTTASATRAGDVLTVSSPGVSYPLSLFTEFAQSQTTGTGIIFELEAGSSTERVELIGGIQLAVVQVAAGAVVANMGIGSIAADATKKAAARFALNDVNGALSGSVGTADTTAALPTNPTSINFGGRGGGSSAFFGYLRKAAIFNSALNDAALQRAST